MRSVCWTTTPLLATIVLCAQGFALAQTPSPQVFATPQLPALEIPAGLPRYDISARLDPESRTVAVRQRVTFTNRSKAPTRELVFHVYPRYKVPDSDRLILAKTLEMLRLSPEEAIDAQGRRLEVGQVKVAGKVVAHTFDPENDTILVVPLPRELPPGGVVTTEIDFTLGLPDTWGRWGEHKGLTYLVNWYPVLAHHDDKGWEHTPFVPWHQPWHQEAGHYRVWMDLPEGQNVASTGRVVDRRPTRSGRQVVSIEATPARDFALVCSERLQSWERQVGGVRVRVNGFKEHEDNAKLMLDYACEVIPLYEKWFGPYPFDEFEIAPSYFGWNGNECSGLVLIDDRVMRLPSAGRRYLDHLVTHETCHQWWWNVVGTDGYAETFMDEGLVNGFTAMRLDAKYGRNGPLIVWPQGLTWLPTIGREDLRLAGYYGWRARGNGGPVIQDLGSMGNLNSLFSLAYDRGGKVIEMIRNRLGEERFFAFFGVVYRKFAYQTFRYADLKRELDAFDPGQGWPERLDAWLINHEDTDWAVGRVNVAAKTDDGVRPVTIELSQNGTMAEPTVVLCRLADSDLRVPIWPDRGSYKVPGAKVERTGDKWVVQVDAPGAPSQVLVDPDHALLDAKPDNNRWKPEVAWRVTPLVTPMDESAQFQAFDRPSIVAGPFVDQYARGGFRIGAQRLERWQITAWTGTEPALSEAIFGGQAVLFHVPGPSWTAGVFYEEGLYNFYNDKRHSGGRLFMRKRLLESSSFLVDDPAFFELYLGTGNEFWAGDDGRPVNGSLTAVGGRYRLSTLFPYWDPVEGRLIETSVEYGSTALGSSRDYVRMTGEYGFVRAAPADWPFFSRWRYAFRAYGGMAFPDNAPYFRLGGGRRLRALDLVQQTGSSVWLITNELRFPIWKDIDYDMLDHIVGFKNVYGALFYDVGQSYLGGDWGPVVHGVGTGLRFDVSLFAFLERATLRMDIAEPIGLGQGPVIWFGLNQVF